MQSYKEKLLDLEQQTNIAKQMYMTGQEEIEEMRSLVEEQANQLDEYRNKVSLNSILKVFSYSNQLNKGQLIFQFCLSNDTSMHYKLTVVFGK